KWRLYLDEDLPSACLLEIVGLRWIEALERTLGDQALLVNARNRLKKLLELNAPEVVIENERRLVRQAEQGVGLGLLEQDDPWEGAHESDEEPESASVVQMRAHQQARLRRFQAQGSYADEYSDISRLVMLINAEIQLARAAFPDQPVYLIKVDLRDYYASIPH